MLILKGIKGIELAPKDMIISLSVINSTDINPKNTKNGSVSKNNKAELSIENIIKTIWWAALTIILLIALGMLIANLIK